MNNQKYGTFLGNSPKDRASLNLIEETESIWTYIFMERLRFVNLDFDQNLPQDQLTIREIPQVNFKLLKEWRTYFYKWCEFGNSNSVFSTGEEPTPLSAEKKVL